MSSMKATKPNRKELAGSLAKYSLAAGAALTAGAASSQADIIYSGATDQAFGGGSGYSLTVEGDNAELHFYGSSSTSSLYVDRRNNSAYVLVEDGTLDGIVALASGSTIGGTANTPASNWGYFSHGGDQGNWASDGDRAFMGFSFVLEQDSAGGGSAGDRVYAWAEVERVGLGEGILHGWGYEDSGEPIQAGATGAVPEPGGLALLALGAAGLGALRRRRKVS